MQMRVYIVCVYETIGTEQHVLFNILPNKYKRPITFVNSAYKEADKIETADKINTMNLLSSQVL